jgi:hypothetical protein
MKTGDSLNLNLLPSQAKFQATRMKLQKRFRRYMVIATGLWVLTILVTAIMYIITGISLNSENNKYQQSFNGFKGMSDEIVMSQLIKYRIKVLGEVLKDRFEYSTAFERVMSIFSEKATMSKFEIDLNKNFKIVVKAVGREAVDFVEDRVVEANKGNVEGVKGISMNSVKYNNNGEWLINMEVQLK